MRYSSRVSDPSVADRNQHTVAVGDFSFSLPLDDEAPVPSLELLSPLATSNAGPPVLQ